MTATLTRTGTEAVPDPGPVLTRSERHLYSVVLESPGKSTSGLRERAGMASSALRGALRGLHAHGLIRVEVNYEPEWGTLAQRVWPVETAGDPDRLAVPGVPAVDPEQQDLARYFRQQKRARRGNLAPSP